MTEGHAGPVLIVDDEPAIRRILRRVVSELGYVVVEAEHGGRALEVLAQLGGRVRLVIADFSMPVLDGLELIRAIRSRWPAVPQICITGYPAEIVALDARFAPPVRAMMKPFDMAALAAEIRAAAGEP